MKTGYKATMKSLAEIIGNTYLDIQFKDETHSSYKACLHECKTNDLGYIVVIYGHGESVEDACEKLFRNLLGTTLIQEGGEETNFNMVLDKYRNSKKKKINNYPTLKECKKIISDNKYHKILITVSTIEKEIIKGR